MEKLKVFLFLLSVFCHAQSLRVQGNQVFDGILDKLRDLEEVRFMSLRSLKVEFRRKVAIATIHGVAKLHDGTVTGLDTAERIGNASIVTDDDGTMTFKGTIGMGVIEFNYKGTVKFMDLGPEVRMQTHTGYVTVYAEIRRMTNGTVDVNQFKVISFEKLRVRFTGLGLLSWTTNYIMYPLMKLLTPLVKSTVEVGVRAVLQRRLPEILSHIDFQ